MRIVALSIELFTITYRFWKQNLCVREFLSGYRYLLVYNLTLWKLFDLVRNGIKHNKEIFITCFYYIFTFSSCYTLSPPGSYSSVQ